jgi:hypothetical protein
VPKCFESLRPIRRGLNQLIDCITSVRCILDVNTVFGIPEGE